MGALLVVVEQPPVRCFAHIVEAGKQVLVQDLLAEGPVEAFDVGVLVGLAGLDVPDGHTVELGPLHEGLAQKLRAVVGAQDLRQAVVALELLEDANQARGRDRRVDFDMQRLAVEVVNHVESPEPATARERVSHEIC
jgi:hypothetical protein